MISKNQAIAEIENERCYAYSYNGIGEHSGIDKAMYHVRKILPYEYFMMAHDVENYGNFTKNGRFIITISNLVLKPLSDKITEENIKLICDHFKIICGGRRVKSKTHIHFDLFIFSKDYSKILRKRLKT